MIMVMSRTAGEPTSATARRKISASAGRQAVDLFDWSGADSNFRPCFGKANGPGTLHHATSSPSSCVAEEPCPPWEEFATLRSPTIARSVSQVGTGRIVKIIRGAIYPARFNVF